MVEFDDLGDLLEPLLELLDLLKVVTKLDHRGRLEHPAFVQDELTMLQRVNVTLDEEQVGAGLDRKETRTRNIDTVTILEVFNGGASGGLELYDSLTVIVSLGVDDDFQFHALSHHDSLQGLEVDPKVVSVEYLELAD